jgi:hypothetical protein
VRTHRVAFSRAYALVPLSVAAVVLGAIMLGCLGFVTQSHPSWSVLVSLALAGLGAELVWRNLVRPRAAWNDSGIALVTSRNVEYLPWEDVRIIKIGNGLKLFAGSKNYLIPTYSASRWLAPGERSPTQLTAALLDSRRRGADTPEDYMPPPPLLDYPARSPALLVLWLISATALTIAVLILGHSGR